MTRPQKWTVGVLSIFALLAMAVYVLDWNLLRGFVERRVTQATGRSFNINGDLSVKVSWHPRIILNDVSMGNAQWSDTPLMVTAQRAELVVALSSLFSREISLPIVYLTRPNLVLEKNSMGVGNWIFKGADSHPADTQSARTIAVRDLQIDDGQVIYRSPIEKADLHVRVSSNQDAPGKTRLLQVHATGKYLDLDAEAHGEVGDINTIEDLQRTYPIQLRGQVGKTRMQAAGTINKPLQFEGLDLKFQISGGSLAELFPLIGVPLPSTAPYSVSGQLEQSGALWDVQQFAGQVGNSDLHGQLSVDRAQRPQFLKANVQSDNLDLRDLSGFIGARAESGRRIVDAQRVLPDQPFSFEKLHATNAEVQFKGKRIKTERLPLDDMTAHLTLNDGQLALEPLAFGVAGGDISSTLHLNAKNSPIETEADILLKNIRIDQLFPGFKFEKANAGVMGGRAKFASQGDSIAKMLGSANGQIAFMMNGGSISKLVVRLANLDVANSVALLVGGDKSMPIRCMVTDLAAVDGDMTVRTLVLDTQKSIITGQGNISFKDETLNLRLTSDPKDISLVALRGPISVKGTFKHPNAAPELKNVSGRVALAAALGALAGPLAFVPLLDLGGGEDSDCAKLLRDAEQHGKQPVRSAQSTKLMNYEPNRSYLSVSF